MYSFLIFILITDVPDQPEGPIKISDINRDRVTLSWAPPKDDGGSKIKSYTVERREQGRSMWSKVDTVDASKTSIVATGLSQGKEYFFRIYAENDIGLSKPLESKQAVIPKSPFGMCEKVFSPTSEQGFFLKFWLTCWWLILCCDSINSLLWTEIITACTTKCLNWFLAALDKFYIILVVLKCWMAWEIMHQDVKDNLWKFWKVKDASLVRHTF